MYVNLPWVPEDIFFLIDTDSWRRSCVNEENATSPPTISIDKKKISSGTQGNVNPTGRAELNTIYNNHG